MQSNMDSFPIKKIDIHDLSEDEKTSLFDDLHEETLKWRHALASIREYPTEQKMKWNPRDNTIFQRVRNTFLWHYFTRSYKAYMVHAEHGLIHIEESSVKDTTYVLIRDWNRRNVEKGLQHGCHSAFRVWSKFVAAKQSLAARGLADDLALLVLE